MAVLFQFSFGIILQLFPALLHKYLKPLRGKDRQLKALIDKTLYDKAFRRKAESLCNNAIIPLLMQGLLN
jgi:hypothetical protein